MALPLAAPGLVAGVDEAGRGPLAGPVVAAAVILDPRRRIRGIRDSKVLQAEEREELSIKIRGTALAWSVAWADVEEIDCLNILQATHLAMRRALIGLRIHPGHVQVDGNLCPSFLGLPMKCSFEAIIDGDALRTCIGAASILAKVTRDRMMVGLHGVIPNTASIRTRVTVRRNTTRRWIDTVRRPFIAAASSPFASRMNARCC